MTDTKPQAVIEGVRKVFADTYALYLKTQNYHWNVTGPHFPSLHALFETQYQELTEPLDQLAERLRILGVTAPGTTEEIRSLASINSGSAAQPAEQMLADLIAGHTALLWSIKIVIRAAEQAGDDGTVGLLSERVASHEKAAWMLRSTLSQ